MPQNDSWNTSYSLLQRLTDTNDEVSWTEFIKNYEGFIGNVLKHTGLNESEIDDLRQNILIKLIKIIPEDRYSKEKGKFRNWLGKVIKNEALTYMKKNSKRGQLLEEHKDFVKDQLNDIKESEIDNYIESEWENQLIEDGWLSVKTQLKDPAKSVFELALKGKGSKEISETLNISQGSVRVYKHRVRDLIKQEIDKLKEL